MEHNQESLDARARVYFRKYLPDVKYLKFEDIDIEFYDNMQSLHDMRLTAEAVFDAAPTPAWGGKNIRLVFRSAIVPYASAQATLPYAKARVFAIDFCTGNQWVLMQAVAA
jgi:hypothetical protein